MNTQTTSTADTTGIRADLAHLAGKPAYWPTLVAGLADELFWLRELHTHECTDPDCGTCQMVGRLWAIVRTHDTLKPRGWTPPVYAPAHLQDAYR